MMHALVCGQLRKEDEWFWSCQEPYFVMSVSAEQIIPAAEGISFPYSCSVFQGAEGVEGVI